MQREMNWEEVSDGKFYSGNDMVKVEGSGCSGCSACCRGMGDSIVLDPYDVYHMTAGLGLSFEELLRRDVVALRMADGLILPYIKMNGDAQCCPFLNGEGRCRIHSFRPGFCRMFPLGRVYENGGFRYFLQVHECASSVRTKCKIHKWLGIPQFRRYESFIAAWHYFLKDAGELALRSGDESLMKNCAMFVLKKFYMTPYEKEVDFYQQFAKRLEEGKRFFF